MNCYKAFFGLLQVRSIPELKEMTTNYYFWLLYKHYATFWYLYKDLLCSYKDHFLHVHISSGPHFSTKRKWIIFYPVVWENIKLSKNPPFTICLFNFLEVFKLSLVHVFLFYWVHWFVKFPHRFHTIILKVSYKKHKQNDSILMGSSLT